MGSFPTLFFFLMCTFRTSCYNKRLSCAHTAGINWTVCLGLKVSKLVVTHLEVSEKEEGVVALQLPVGPLKPSSGLEPVLRCEPSTYQPIS